MISGNLNFHSHATLRAEIITPLYDRKSTWLALTFKHKDGMSVTINLFTRDSETLAALTRIADAINKESSCLNPQPQAPSPSESIPTSIS